MSVKNNNPNTVVLKKATLPCLDDVYARLIAFALVKGTAVSLKESRSFHRMKNFRCEKFDRTRVLREEHRGADLDEKVEFSWPLAAPQFNEKMILLKGSANKLIRDSASLTYLFSGE